MHSLNNSNYVMTLLAISLHRLDLLNFFRKYSCTNDISQHDSIIPEKNTAVIVPYSSSFINIKDKIKN